MRQPTTLLNNDDTPYHGGIYPIRKEVGCMANGYTLADLLTILGIIGVLATWFHHVALKPIKQLLFALKEDIMELSAEVRASREDRREFDARISRLEEAIVGIREQLKLIKEDVLNLEK